MKNAKKTNSELIIDTLRNGRPLRSPEITSMVSEAAGKDIKIQDVASILAKLSNSNKCDLGYLIRKKKTDRGYEYSLVKEAYNLSPEETYDLTRKTGKDRFTLDEAMKKSPGLKKYVKSERKAETRKSTRGPARQLPAPSTRQVTTDADLRGLVAGLIREVSEQGGFNINVNLTIQFKGPGS